MKKKLKQVQIDKLFTFRTGSLPIDHEGFLDKNKLVY